MNRFIYKPFYVAIVSLLIAIIIGYFGYAAINASALSANSQGSGSDSLSIVAEASSTVQLGFLASGEVSRIYVEPGQIIEKGSIIAEISAQNISASLVRAESVYEQAKANYEKILNGATGPALDNARSSVNSAKTGLDEAQKYHDTLVANAKRAYLNASLMAQPYDETGRFNTLKLPVVSGSYTGDKEGQIKIRVYDSIGGQAFSIEGIATGTGIVSSAGPEPIADSGLYIMFPQTTDNYANSEWKIVIPNTSSASYITAYNTYLSAIQAREQALANARAMLDQANASYALVAQTARPEDVSSARAQYDSARAALMAEPAFMNTAIIAPFDGEVVSVDARVGQKIEAGQTAVTVRKK